MRWSVHVPRGAGSGGHARTRTIGVVSDPGARPTGANTPVAALPPDLHQSALRCHSPPVPPRPATEEERFDGYHQETVVGVVHPADCHFRHHAVDGSRDPPAGTPAAVEDRDREWTGRLHPPGTGNRSPGLAELRWPADRLDLGPWRADGAGLVGRMAAQGSPGDPRGACTGPVRQQLRGAGRGRQGQAADATTPRIAQQHLRPGQRHHHHQRRTRPGDRHRQRALRQRVLR